MVAFENGLKEQLTYGSKEASRAQNNGQQVAGHDDRPNIF